MISTPKTWLTALLVCAGTSLYAQPESSPVDNLVPPSPEAAALGKYAMVPVGLYTGIPEISIPLWEVNEGDLKLPVSLSYHASGNKVDDIASRVGLGWVLNAGGVISRTVVGQPDEYGDFGYLNLTRTRTPEAMRAEGKSDEEQMELWQRITRKCWDFEPDQFAFNFNGISGRFGFEWNSDGNASMLIASENKLKIEPIGLPAYGAESYILAWRVTDQHGTLYLFEAQELTQLNPIEGENEDPDNVFDDCYDRAATPTSWYLTQIQSANGNWIRFTYSDYDLKYQLRTWESTKSMITSDDPGHIRRKTSHLRFTGKNLSRITTSSGYTTIDFVETAGAARTDLPTAPMVLGSNNLKRLEDIIVRNRKGENVKHFRMNHTYETGRLTLKNLTELAVRTQATLKPSYVFTYDPTTLPAFPKRTVTLPGGTPIELGTIVGFYTQDHWGYYNSNPKETLISIENSTDAADRSPDAVRMKAGLLTQIRYPTGGTTTFDFEPHTYSAIGNKDVGENRMAGGVRIYKITDADGAGTPIVRDFEYKLDNNLTSGVIAQLPWYKFYTVQVITLPDGSTGAVSWPLYAANSLTPLAMTRGSYIGYREVTVYQGQNREGGKSKSYFTSFYTHNDDYRPIPGKDEFEAFYPPYFHPESYEYARGLLTKQVDYKYENAQYTPVRQLDLEHDINAASAKAFKTAERLPGVFSPDGMGRNSAETLMAITFYDYRMGFAKLKRSIETIFENGQAFRQEKTYSYNYGAPGGATEKFNMDGRFLQLESQKTSTGWLATHYIYPFNYGDYFPYNEMKSRHILSPVIEKIGKEVSPGTFPGAEVEYVVNGSFTTYSLFNNIFQPTLKYSLSPSRPIHDFSFSTTHPTGEADLRYYTPVTFHTLYTAKGRPREVRQTTDLTTLADDEVSSYIYDNGSSLLIAKVTNGLADQSAFTDFENGINEGRWNFSDWLPNFSTDAKTGDFSFSGELNSDLVPAGTYTVSLWAAGPGMVTVQGISKMVATDWRRYEWTITLPAQGSVDVVTNGNLIDGLRLHAKNARMTTFTHHALIGVTSMTDENHQTTYYEYDGLNRLETVRDSDRNIVKHYDYKYKQ